jgi:hypothetical protein
MGGGGKGGWQLPVITVLGYVPRFEEASGLWYADIEVNADKSYLPFSGSPSGASSRTPSLTRCVSHASRPSTSSSRCRRGCSRSCGTATPTR